MVEGTPLLRAQTVKSCLEGSNPFLSAISFGYEVEITAFFIFTPPVTLRITLSAVTIAAPVVSVSHGSVIMAQQSYGSRRTPNPQPPQGQ